MLMLWRKLGERVIIELPDGRSFPISVEQIRKNLDGSPSKVQLGFDAPPDVIIHREEIYDQIHHDGAKQG